MSLNVNNVANQAMHRNANDTAWDLTTFTIEAFVYLNDATALSAIWDRGASDSPESMTWFVNTSNQTSVVVDVGQATTNSIAGTTTLSNATWYRLAFTWDGTINTNYVNAAADGQKSSAQTIDTTAKDTGLGKTAPTSGRLMHGEMSDIRFWNFVRSTGAMSGDSLTRLVGNESGLIGYWKLNETSGNSAADSTSNNRPFTATAAVWDTGNDPAFSTGGAATAPGYISLLGVGGI